MSLGVLNSPFYAMGISYQDIVSVKIELDICDILVFDAVVVCGGHSTYRIALNETTEEAEFDARWVAFSELGCTYESFLCGALRMYAVDVPPSANVRDVYSMLELGVQEGGWEVDEGKRVRPKK